MHLITTSILLISLLPFRGVDHLTTLQASHLHSAASDSAWIPAGVYAFPRTVRDSILFSGSTAHFSEMAFSGHALAEKSGPVGLTDAHHEQILIVKSGTLAVKHGDTEILLHAKDVCVIYPGDPCTVQSASGETHYYRMWYRGYDAPSADAVPAAPCIVFHALAFQEQPRGGRRDYFRTSTPMCPYYEMHMTDLKPGIPSHAPHTHHAAEIILVTEGQSEMEIGGKTYQGQAGDLYYIPADVLHGVRNSGNVQCQYFAYQWDTQRQ